MKRNSNLFNYYGLSHYEIDGKYHYDNSSKRFELKSIYSIFINKPVTDHSEETNLFFSLPEKRDVQIKNYDDKFYVLQIGKAKKLWFPNEQAINMVEDEFKISNGILAYWDSNSLAFIVQTKTLMNVVKDFLESVPYIGYFKDKEGILLVK